MSQVSYGTITITDTTDIERIYVEYCRSTSNQLDTSVNPPVVPNITVAWSENTPPWVNGQYIWQRSVVKKSGSTNLTYGTPVCLTGAVGATGAAGQSLTATKTEYTIAASNVTINLSNHTSYTWTTNTPDYDSSKPAYWGRITNTYTNPAKTEYLFYKDEALTKAVADAAIANSIAQHANEDAQGAMSQSSAALQRVQAKYGTSSTGATTVAKVASCEGFQLFNGAEVFIKFTNKNNVANPTLNVNNTGAKSIRDSDGNALDSKFYWKDGSLVHFVYDGTYWRILDIVTTEKYNDLVSDINGISQTVGTKASQTDLTNLTTRVSTNETNISQTATSITSLVSNQDTYTAPDGTTKTNTIKSAIKQNADNISLRVEKNGVIAAINASTESSGGSAVKISADKVNIEGAAIFTSGRLSTTNLNNTIDGRIPEIPDDISDLTDTTGKIPTKVTDLSDSSNYAKTTDIPDVSGFAVKTDAVYRTQRIYRRYTSVQSNLSGPTTWVTANTNIYNNWTTKIPPLTNGSTIYAYLYTCVQKQTITQYNGGTGTTCTCTPVLLDDTTTVINGGNIIAGSVTANEITGNTLSAIYANMGTLTAGKIEKGYNSINFDNTPATLEFKNQSTWDASTQGIRYNSNGLAIKGAITATQLTISGGGAIYDGASAINANGYTIEIIDDKTAAPTGSIITENQTYLYPVMYLNGEAVTTGITKTNYIWYTNENTATTGGVAGDSTNGGIIATYGNTYRVTYNLSDDAVGTTPSQQTIYTSDARHITDISSSGITIHPEDGSAGNYMQLDSDGLKIYKSSTLLANYGTTVTIGNSSAKNVYIDSNGVQIRDGSISLASFGTTAQIGQNESSRFLMNSDSLQAYNSSNVKYFEVNANGLSWGSNTAATTTQVNAAAQTASNYITTVGNDGIKLHPYSEENNYTLINSNGMQVYQEIDNVATKIAEFGSSGTLIGKTSGAHTTIDNDGMQIYTLGVSGNLVQLANLGYGEGTDETGGISNAPYYSFGTRNIGSVIGNYSTSCGTSNEASGYASFAEGSQSVATGTQAHVGGQSSTASGDYSFAYGDAVTASGLCQTVIGRLNNPQGSPTERTSTDLLLIIGNGYWEYEEDESSSYYVSHESNALTVDWSGLITANGFKTGYNTGAISINGSTHATALQSWFNSDKASISRNSLHAVYSGAYNNGALCMGYFLPGYDTSPYGGFYVCHYNNARYVGIMNGTYTQYELTKTTSSSRRIKENIKLMTDDEAKKLYALNVISFDYKKDYEEGKKNQFGLIAEDCDEIIPYVVYKPDNNKDTIWGIDYVKFVPFLIKNLQIHEQEIKELKQEVKELKKLIVGGIK